MNLKPAFLVQLVGWMLHPLIRRVQFLEGTGEKLNALHQQGQVLYVAQSVSFIDYLILKNLLKRFALPPISFTHGFSPFLYYPFFKAIGEALANLFSSRQRIWEKARTQLLHASEQGQNGLVFLKRSEYFGSKLEYYSGFFGPLSAYASQSEKPVFLVPVSIFLTRKRKNKLRNTWEILFGTYDTPGRMRKLIQLVASGRKGMVLFSKPIDLTGEIKSGPFKDHSPEKMEKGLRRILLWHLNNEDRAYRGPTKKSVEQKIHAILKDKRLRKELEKVAERQERSFESVLKEARKNLNEMTSDTSEKVINLLRLIFDFVWARTLEGIDYNPQDFNRMRELNKSGPIVFLPCHRSHVDYLVFAYLFEKAGLNNPRFAAGDNLSKWPLGPILRRAGAFFIRRSFKGEVIFPLVFEAYLRQILQRGLNLTFFMEGGRSRTGKLLHPKVGMLKMVVDAWEKGVIEDLPFVPITIDYGKVFEGKAYLSENTGQEKQKENFRALLKTPKVLTKKHGVIRIRFGNPIYLKDYVAAKGLQREALDYKNKLPLIYELGNDVLMEVNQMVTITAANVLAGILMSNPRRGMTLKDIRTIFVITTSFLARRHVELAFPEKNLDTALQNALETFKSWETVVAVDVAGETIVRIPEDKRPEMEYYKNNGLHFILDLALAATALRTLDGPWTLANCTERAQELYDLLSMEFLFPTPYPSQINMERAIKALADRGGLVIKDDTIVLGDQKLGRDLYRICGLMLLNFMESYFVVCDVLIQQNAALPLNQKDLVKAMLNRGHLLYAVGHLRLKESINKVNFENGLARLNKWNLIQFKTPAGQKHPHITLKGGKLGDLEALREKIFTWMNACG
ncbi:MAG: 1-acyl-sn-glycerol-3-phosphate acyltransferase [Acidobacteria bacterium]|nr:1-acyl-sn-glycerol-3-phosphate acyltransferase [Acidobacteriota bacterium]